jgi:calcium/calmodulin-dependent protein kinase I
MEGLSRVGSIEDNISEAYRAPKEETVFGQGAYATVTLMRARDDTPVAVKKMNAVVDFECIEREIHTLLAVQPHPNVIGYRGFFWNQDSQGPRISVVFDAASKGDLLAKVLQPTMLSEAEAKCIFRDMMKGIAHVHAHDIVHRDIKAQNILSLDDNCVVIADFGLATWQSNKEQMARRCGSPGYVAPEVCLGKCPYTLKVDVFGAGVILYLMLSKEMPFSSPDRDTAATMRRTVKCTLHLRRPPWDGYSSALRGMLRETITKEQEDRLSAADVLRHAWLLKASKSSKNSSMAAGLPDGMPREKLLPAETPRSRMAAIAEEDFPRRAGLSRPVVGGVVASSGSSAGYPKGSAAGPLAAVAATPAVAAPAAEAPAVATAEDGGPQPPQPPQGRPSPAYERCFNLR